LETALLRAVWYGTTVATQSYTIKQVILDYLERTGDPTTIDFKLHDFGARGVSSLESAGIGGAAHLVNFMGSDTISGVLFAREYYNAGIAGFSIPAAEHSTITSWGREGEVDAYRNMLNQFAKPGSIVAIVSDSYDVYNAAEKLWGEALREQVVASGATVVIRPDSGDPVEVNRKLIEILGSKFGYTKNAKGFMANGWSADNIAFGMGGALLQAVDRDTQKFAMKCSSAQVNGQWINVQKDPVTDSVKKSKAGRVTLWTNGTGEYVSGTNDDKKPWADRGWSNALDEVYRDGKLIKEISFDDVRTNAKK
jgi:nicotinamide phosphoribosyltransferase